VEGRNEDMKRMELRKSVAQDRILLWNGILEKRLYSASAEKTDVKPMMMTMIMMTVPRRTAGVVHTTVTYVVAD
jgi:hypothetical protein